MKQLGAKKSLFRGEEQVAELGGKAIFVRADLQSARDRIEGFDFVFVRHD